MRIKDLPSFNKPSSKLLRNGAESLDTAELLAIIFGVGNKNESALEMSNRILKACNLHRIEDLGLKELINLIKDKREEAETRDYVRAMQLFSLVELSKRYNKLSNKGYKKEIRSAKDILHIFVDKFRNYKKEVLSVVLLDTKNQVMSIKEVSVGTLNSSLIHPREVFKEAIKESAYAIILVHNHPSGDPKPSEEDIEITKSLIEAGKMLNILVLDHVIIGGNKYWNWLDFKS